MGRKAKHHYIPKCYLKEFTDGGGNSSPFWCVPVNDDVPFPTSPNKACAKRDYYSIQHENSLIVEDWYANEIEPKIRQAIDHIKEHSSLPPKEEMCHLILLLATLYLRVPTFRALLEAPMERTREIVESMSRDVKIRNKDDFNYSQTDLIRSEIKLIDTVQKSLANKYFQLHMIGDAKTSVITSDNPFVLSHPNGGKGFYFGLDTPNIEICVPITKKAIVIARNERIKEGTFIATEELIGLANMKLRLSASHFFYTSDEDVLLVNDDLSVYKHNIHSI